MLPVVAIDLAGILYRRKRTLGERKEQLFYLVRLSLSAHGGRQRCGSINTCHMFDWNFFPGLGAQDLCLIKTSPAVLFPILGTPKRVHSDKHKVFHVLYINTKRVL